MNNNIKNCLIFLAIWTIGMSSFIGILYALNNTFNPNFKTNTTKVYLVSKVKYNEEWIERVYLKPEKAQEYVDAYKERHDYSIKEIAIEE